jgi:hypothetical protein
MKTFAYPDQLFEAPKLSSTMCVESIGCSWQAEEEGNEIAQQEWGK